MESRYPPNGMVPGTVYRVIRELGAGGMGRVYEVEDTTLGKHYALKTVANASAVKRQGHERLNLEPPSSAGIAPEHREGLYGRYNE
jgi:serine/threonine protein kinase